MGTRFPGAVEPLASAAPGSFMAGPIKPLLPEIRTPEQLEEGTKFGLGIAALLTVGRLFPQTSAPIARTFFGIRLSEAGAPVGITKFFPLNFGPFPLGFFPASTFGAAPNYYLPRGIAGHLPTFIPGVPEQRAQEEAEARAGPPTLAQLTTPGQVTNFLNLFGNESLQDKLARAQQNRFAIGTLSPADTARLIQAELSRREEQRIADNARLGFNAEGKPLMGPAVDGGRPPRPAPTVVQRETTSPASPEFEGFGPLPVSELSLSQLRAEVADAQLSLQLSLFTPGAFTNQVEVERFRMNLARAQAELAARQASPPVALGPPGPPQSGGSPGSTTPGGSGPGGSSFNPGAGPGPAGPKPPGGSSSSNTPLGPLTVPGSNTPGATPGQPRWPRNSPDPSGVTPDVFVQHRAGDP